MVKEPPASVSVRSGSGAFGCPRITPRIIASPLAFDIAGTSALAALSGTPSPSTTMLRPRRLSSSPSASKRASIGTSPLARMLPPPPNASEAST